MLEHPKAAWEQAADLSNEVNVKRVPHPFKTVLSQAPKMYDDLWVGGKCMYKLEPVVADGGELIIYAPHITEVSPVHGAIIERIGYHTLPYFLADWDKFKERAVGHSGALDARSRRRKNGGWRRTVPRIQSHISDGHSTRSLRKD